MTDPVTVTRAELRELIREAVRDELREVGLRTDDANHAEAVRDDLRFARRMRKSVEATASKIGMLVITAVAGGAMLALWEGLKFLQRPTG
jgi:hypothetical protein